MTSLVTIQKEVEKIRQAVTPRHAGYLNLVWSWPINPHRQHGKYGVQIVVMDRGTGENVDYNAYSEKEEIEFIRGEYARIDDDVKQRYEPWSTFEKYLRHHRCRCGFHKLYWAREDELP